MGHRSGLFETEQLRTAPARVIERVAQTCSSGLRLLRCPRKSRGPKEQVRATSPAPTKALKQAENPDRLAGISRERIVGLVPPAGRILWTPSFPPSDWRLTMSDLHNRRDFLKTSALAALGGAAALGAGDAPGLLPSILLFSITAVV